MGAYNSGWLRWVAMAMLVCLVLQGCTVQMWDEINEQNRSHGEVNPGLVALGILATPVTLAVDVALVAFYVWANTPTHHH